MTSPMEDQPRLTATPEFRTARKLFIAAGFVMVASGILANISEPTEPVAPVEPTAETTTTLPVPIADPVYSDPSYTG